jgi:hypothetical protein
MRLRRPAPRGSPISSLAPTPPTRRRQPRCPPPPAVPVQPPPPAAVVRATRARRVPLSMAYAVQVWRSFPAREWARAPAAPRLPAGCSLRRGLLTGAPAAAQAPKPPSQQERFRRASLVVDVAAMADFAEDDVDETPTAVGPLGVVTPKKPQMDFATRRNSVLAQARRPASRVRSHCRFAPPLIHCMPDYLKGSVALFVKRHCDRTLPTAWRPSATAPHARLAARGLEPRAAPRRMPVRDCPCTGMLMLTRAALAADGGGSAAHESGGGDR